jgi:uncharacterized protein (TIGR00288 family)
MRSSDETNLALFIDFDNVALGARDAGVRLRIDLLLGRLLEKGKIIVKKAYADWSHHKEYMADLHEAAIELVEIPSPKRSGKNSADIRLAVDAMELCHDKEHIDTYVIVSGDSDFSPLVSKLRENNKSVIGVGMKNSSARLLIGNCDEFIFYDDLAQERVPAPRIPLTDVPENKRQLFDFLLSTIEALMREGRDTLFSSLIKDAMKRKQPDFNQSRYGYSAFGDLLEDAQAEGLLEVTRDKKAGGTWVVTGITTAPTRPAPAVQPAAESKPRAASAPRSTSRPRRRGGVRRTAARRSAAGPAADARD